jgi:hypothetical protein
MFLVVLVKNQELKMEDERILQHVQENPIMVEEDVNPSCVFSIDVNEPHCFVEALNDEDSQH